MTRNALFVLPLALLLAPATTARPVLSAAPTDSVGVERRDGKRYVLHRVDQGQTLYAVARRYHTSVDAIKAANPDLTDNVRFDQLLRVPMADAASSRREQREAERSARKDEKTAVSIDMNPAETDASKADPKAERTPSTRTAPPANGLHVVEAGQTLYSLAVRYSVTMADLRHWNNLGADGIQTGQSLIVTERAYEAKNGTTATTTSPTRPTRIPSGRTAESTRPPEPEPTKLEAKPIVTPDPLPTPGSRPRTKPADKTPETRPTEKTTEPHVADTRVAETRPTERTTEPKTTEPRSDNEPVPVATTTRKTNVKSEMGFADIIEGNDASSKYLALHRSAPIGTLVQVRNDITNQTLYVKVVGKLPDTGLNNQVLIRLSGRAFEKLSPNGQRFRAEVSYAN